MKSAPVLVTASCNFQEEDTGASCNRYSSLLLYPGLYLEHLQLWSGACSNWLRNTGCNLHQRAGEERVLPAPLDPPDGIIMSGSTTTLYPTYKTYTIINRSWAMFTSNGKICAQTTPRSLGTRVFFSTLPIGSGRTPRGPWQTSSPFRWRTRDSG